MHVLPVFENETFTEGERIFSSRCPACSMILAEVSASCLSKKVSLRGLLPWLSLLLKPC